MNTNKILSIFEKAIEDYHIENRIEQNDKNPFEANSMEHILYHKTWIDTVQWHCEDEVRNPQISAENVRLLKNKIDFLNQTRTNIVEQIDDYFWEKFKTIQYDENARLNTESPAWAMDRLSILALKIYHMKEETLRSDLSEANKINYLQKYELLLTQRNDLTQAIQQLFSEIEEGKTIYKLYRQVKMYNDSDLNPILRKENER